MKIASSALLGFLLVASFVSAQQSDLEVSQNIEKDARARIKILANPATSPRKRAAAASRLGNLSTRFPTETEKYASDIIDALLRALKKTGSNKVAVRSAACAALPAFDGTLHSSDIITAMKKAALKDSSPEVVSQCAQALGNFERSKYASSKALIAYVQKRLRVKKRDNIEPLIEAINAMGKLKHKQSFITLLKVLDSDYPSPVKRAAKEAINNLEWGEVIRVK